MRKVLFLRKLLLVVPIRSVLEQTLNSLHLVSKGLGKEFIDRARTTPDLHAVL